MEFVNIPFNLLVASLLQAKRAKQAEIDRKRAEVRKRMEEASKAKKAKKGFMTPDRKKKLRVSWTSSLTSSIYIHESSHLCAKDCLRLRLMRTE